MKNLQNYAKNVQLVKRNIILCVACFYIASFPLNWDNGGSERGFVEDTTTSDERFSWLKQARSDEHNEIYFIKMTIKKLVDRERGKKGLQAQLFLPAQAKKALECGKFQKFSFCMAPRQTALAGKCLNVQSLLWFIGQHCDEFSSLVGKRNYDPHPPNCRVNMWKFFYLSANKTPAKLIAKLNFRFKSFEFREGSATKLNIHRNQDHFWFNLIFSPIKSNIKLSWCRRQ